ncbi:MAG: hypothetical protein KDA45_16015 [Planctomycetales bacterium]|nr:hypothetical protein [Planctomycetales bacterium]
MAPPGAAASAPPSADLASDSSPSTRWLPQDELDRQAVLLIQSGGKLHRLQPGEASPAGSRWLAPPTTRTTIDLPQGALWTVCGPSLLQFGFAAEPRLPTVHTQLCRSLIRGGPDGRQLLLSTPLGAYRLELADASSRASIEVSYRPTRPGSVLERRAFKPVLIIVAAEGSLTVHVQSAVPSAAAENGAANGDSRPANQPQAISLALGDGLAVVAGENMEKFRLQNIPRWYRSSVEREVDGLAGEDLHHFLDAAAESDPGLWQTLSTLSGYRRPETAALAGQLSLMAGNWQPLVADYLNNERMRSHWKNTLDLSRQIVASDSAAAEALRTAFVDAHGERGQKLFELLCGLSEEQLAGNGLEELVKNLEAERLDQRVLAIYQLFLLTGKSLGYQPHAPTRASVLAWRKELQANRLSVVPPPDVIWERIPR